MREAMAVTAGRAELEAPGGVMLAQLRNFAATGVDRISLGKLTKYLRAVDFSMRVAGLYRPSEPKGERRVDRS